MQFGEREAHIRAELGRAGPWSARRPLPAPFSLEQLPRDRQNVMIILSVIAGCSMLITLALVIYLAYQYIYGRSNVSWASLKRPVSAKAQVTILFLHTFFAQLMQSLAWLLSIAHLMRDSVKSPDRLCEVQALLQTSGSFFSQSCITSIAIHSALIVFRLRPISLRGFLALVGSLWLSTFILGLAAPMIINHFVAVPFLVYHKTSCYINLLYPLEVLVLVYIPLLFNMGVAICAYPFIYFRITGQLQRLQRFQPEGLARILHKNANTLQASGRLLIFPVVIFMGNLPFMVLTIYNFIDPDSMTKRLWPTAVGSCCLAMVPIVNTLIYFFATPLFKMVKLETYKGTLGHARSRISSMFAHNGSNSIQLIDTESRPSCDPRIRHISTQSFTTSFDSVRQASSLAQGIAITQDTIISTSEVHASRRSDGARSPVARLSS